MEESIEDRRGDGVSGAGGEGVTRGLVVSRNISLEKWANLVLQRHGGRFATHHVFFISRVQHGSQIEESPRKHAQRDEEELP